MAKQVILVDLDTGERTMLEQFILAATTKGAPEGKGHVRLVCEFRGKEEDGLRLIQAVLDGSCQLLADMLGLEKTTNV